LLVVLRFLKCGGWKRLTSWREGVRLRIGIPDRRGCDGWGSSSWIGTGTSLEACVDWRGCDKLDGWCSSCLGLGEVVGGLEVSGIHRNGVLSSLELGSSWSDLGLIWFMWHLITHGCSKNKYHKAYVPIDDSFYPLFSPGVIFCEWVLVRRILFWFDMLAFSLFFKKLT